MADLNPLNSLPQEIALDIFYKLPAGSVLDCKLVCRAWRNFLQFHAHTTHFATQHLHQQQLKPSDSETMSFVAFDRHAQAFWYLEYHDDGDRINDNPPNYRVKTMNMEFPADVCVGRLGLVGSENGLICLSLKTGDIGIISLYHDKLSHSAADEALCICNPITREFVTLPGISMSMKKWVDEVLILPGFGYHPLTKEYKVVRICYVGRRESPSYKGQIEVYTIGSGRGWRRVGETNFKPTHLEPRGICVNGALHWLCENSMDVMAFDLADEKFHLLRGPIEEVNEPRRIYVMRQCLCYEYCDGHISLHLCLLEKNSEEYCKSWSWNTKFTIPLEMLHPLIMMHFIFSIAKMGEILFITNGQKEVLRYPSQRTEISQKDSELNGITRDWKVPLPHINTFVSLEALGEKNVKKLVAEKWMCKRHLERKEASDDDRPVSSAGTRQTKKLREDCSLLD